MSRAPFRLPKVIPSFLATLLVVGVLWVATPASAGRHSAGWTEFCPFIKTTTDDPIWYHGKPGKAPSHDFFGNYDTDAYSTFDSLRQTPTDCLSPYDASAYYAPQMFLNGKPVKAKTTFEYYWAPKGNSYQDVKPVPSGLVMYGNRFYFTCTGQGVKAPHKQVPFDCTPYPGSRVTAYVYLPNCWDGVHL